jgi:hypothetical protein
MIQVIQPTPGPLEMFGQSLAQGIPSAIDSFQKRKQQQAEEARSRSQLQDFLKANPDLPQEQKSILEYMAAGGNKDIGSLLFKSAAEAQFDKDFKKRNPGLFAKTGQTPSTDSQQADSQSGLQEMDLGQQGGSQPDINTELTPEESGASGMPSMEERLLLAQHRPGISKVVENEVQHRRAEEAELQKSSAPAVKQIVDNYNKARSENLYLKGLKSLNPDRKVGPWKSYIARELDIPIGAFNDPTSELFDKMSAKLSLGSVAGGSRLAAVFDAIARSTPTLANTPEGVDMIIDSMITANKEREIEFDALREVRRRNGGKLPRDWEEQMADFAKPKLAALEEEFTSIQPLIQVMDPNGVVGWMPRLNVDRATKAGYRRL